MKTIRAKALASLLAGFVTLAGFSGCHASSAAMFSESATISASSAPQDSASSTTQISQTSEAGTYVQDDMTELMPQTYAYFTDLRLSADGAVEVVGLSQSGGIQLLRWTDDVWETAVESSQPAVANGALTVAADGTLWTVCRDDSGAYTLQSGTDPAAMQTIPVEALSQEEALPISLRLAADGKIFLTAQVGETTVFVLVDPATRQATTVTPGFYGSPAFYAEGSIYTFAAGSTSLSVLDATNGSVLQQYSLPLAEPLARANGYFVRQGVQLAKVSQRYDGTDGNPTPSELNLDAVMAQLTTPSNTDLSLRELVYENAAQLYTGAQDLETTVANILQRTDLYYAEQQ